MKILLECTECRYQEWGRESQPLMNKIIMWNHVKRAHAHKAEQVMARHQMLPDNFYGTRTLRERTLQW